MLFRSAISRVSTGCRSCISIHSSREAVPTERKLAPVHIWNQLRVYLAWTDWLTRISFRDNRLHQISRVWEITTKVGIFMLIRKIIILNILDQDLKLITSVSWGCRRPILTKLVPVLGRPKVAPCNWVVLGTAAIRPVAVWSAAATSAWSTRAPTTRSATTPWLSKSDKTTTWAPWTWAETNTPAANWSQPAWSKAANKHKANFN